MRINIEDIKSMIEERAKFNALALGEIEFYENGKKVDIDESIIKEFKFVGLNNVDFISTGFYLSGFDELGEVVPRLYGILPCGCPETTNVEIRGKDQCACGIRR